MTSLFLGYQNSSSIPSIPGGAICQVSLSSSEARGSRREACPRLERCIHDIEGPHRGLSFELLRDVVSYLRHDSGEQELDFSSTLN